MLYIILPVHNRCMHTLQFLQDLKRQPYRPYRCVVSDSGSTDGTIESVRSEFPETIIVPGSEDLFWSGAINAGLDYLKNEELVKSDDFIAFANNDVSFAHNTIKVLVNCCKKNNLAAYHPLVYDHNQICLSSGGRLLSWPFFITRHPFRGKKAANVKSSDLVEVNLATARFLLFHNSILATVARTDAKCFPHYAGDNDFSMNLWRKGIKTYIVPSARCKLDTATTGENPRLKRNFSAFIRTLKSIRSTNNLIIRAKFGFKHCPRYWLPFYLISVMLRVVAVNLVKSY